MNRDTKAVESEGSEGRSGSEEKTSIDEGEEETNSEKDKDGKEERAILATKGKPIQEPRTRRNRDIEVTEFEESTGSKEETSTAKGKEEIDSKKD